MVLTEDRLNFERKDIGCKRVKVESIPSVEEE